MPGCGSMSSSPGAVGSMSARWPIAMPWAWLRSRHAHRATTCAWCPRGLIFRPPGTLGAKVSCPVQRGCAPGSVRSSHCSTGAIPGRHCTTIGISRRGCSASRCAAWCVACAAETSLARVEREHTLGNCACSGRGREDSAAGDERAARKPIALHLPAVSIFSGYAVAAALRHTLERLGAAAAFGLPGGPNRELFLALRGSSVRLVVPSHELAAAFMAGGYGRVSGRPGVLLTIPGPGFAYALAGIAEAWQDSAPLVHIVAAPPEPPHQRLRHQGLDQTAIAAPMVKAVFSVEDPTRLASDLADAFD